MRHIHIDVPYLVIALEDDRHHLRRLEKIDRLEATVAYEARNAGRLATRTWRVGDLSGKHFIVTLFHSLLDPRLQVRIGEIGNSERWLHSSAILKIGVGWIGTDRPWPYASNLEEIELECNPPRFVRRKVGRPRLLLRSNTAGQRRTDEAGHACEKTRSRDECPHRCFSCSFTIE